MPDSVRDLPFVEGTLGGLARKKHGEGKGAMKTIPQMVFRRMARNVRDYGLATTLKKTLSYLLGPIFGRRVYRIYRIDLSAFEIEVPDDSRFIYRFIDKNDTRTMRQIEDVAEWLEGCLAGKLANGSLCLVASDESVLAGFNLVSFGHVYIPLLRRHRLFRDGEAWSEDIMVCKEYRRIGLASILRNRIFSELRRRGIKRFYGGTLISNTAALSLTRKVGFREIADAGYLRLMAFSRVRFRRARG